MGVPSAPLHRSITWVGVALVCLAFAYAASSSNSMWISAALLLAIVFGLLTNMPRYLIGLAYIAILAGSFVDARVATAFFGGRFLTYVGIVGGNCLNPLRIPSRMEGLLFGAMAAFLATAVASIGWSIDPSLSIFRAVGLLLLFIAVATTMLARWHSESDIVRDLAWIGAISSIVAILNLALFAFFPNAWAYSGDRFRGLLQNPNTTGIVIGLTFPIVLMLATKGVSRHRRYWVGAAILQAAAVVLSQSRGGITAAAIGAGGFLLFHPSRRARIRLLATCLISLIAFLFVLAAPTLTPDTIDSLLSRFRGAGEAAGGSGRLMAWGLALEIWKQRPLTGWGFGTVEYTFGVRAVEIDDFFAGSHPHNAFLELLLDVGPLGLLALMAALAVAYWSVLRRPRDVLTAGLGGVMFAGLVLMFVESGLTAAGSIYGFLFWFATGAAVASGRFRGISIESTSPARSVLYGECYGFRSPGR